MRSCIGQVNKPTVKNSVSTITCVVFLLQETQIQNVIDTAEEIGGKVRVVKKPRITGNKRKRKTDCTRELSDGKYAANLRSPPQA